MNKRALLINVVLGVGLIAAYWLVAHYARPPQNHPEQVKWRTVVPLLKNASGVLEPQQGPSIDLQSAYPGKILVINFWASWCGACKQEKTTLEGLGIRYHDTDVQVLGVASDDTGEGIRKHPELAQASYPLFFDHNGELASQLRVRSLPMTIVFDAAGEERLRIAIPLLGASLGQLQEGIEQLRAQTLAVRGETAPASHGVEAEASVSSLVPDFRLTNQGGALFSASSLKEHVWVVNTVFTSCTSICPVLTGKMKQLQDEFAGDSGFHLVSISVDPEHDTPAILTQYMASFTADLKRWTFLTGAWSDIKALLTSTFGMRGTDGPSFHSDHFFLIDRGMKIHRHYAVNSADELNILKNDIRRLLSSVEGKKFSDITHESHVH